MLRARAFLRNGTKREVTRVVPTGGLVNVGLIVTSDTEADVDVVLDLEANLTTGDWSIVRRSYGTTRAVVLASGRLP